MFPSASLKRDLVGSGYHRELVTSVELGGTALNSRVLLVENITRDIYMDIDQVLMPHGTTVMDARRLRWEGRGGGGGTKEPTY